MGKKILHLAYAAAGITTTGMADILRRVDGDTTEDQAARVQAVVTPLLAMAFTDGRSFLTDTVKSTKATKEGKADPVVEVRASEARQILGALKMIPGYTVAGKGWQAAVNASRAALKAAGIKASGDKVLTDAQQADKAIKAASVPLLAELMVSDLPDEAKVSRLAEIKAEAAATVANSEVSKHAARIVKGNGLDYARKLVISLALAITAAELAEVPAAESVTTETVPVGQADVLAVTQAIDARIMAEDAAKPLSRAERRAAAKEAKQAQA